MKEVHSFVEMRWAAKAQVTLRYTHISNLTLSCPGTGRAVVKIGHSNLWPGSKELIP